MLCQNVHVVALLTRAVMTLKTHTTPLLSSHTFSRLGLYFAHDNTIKTIEPGNLSDSQVTRIFNAKPRDILTTLPKTQLPLFTNLNYASAFACEST